MRVAHLIRDQRFLQLVHLPVYQRGNDKEWYEGHVMLLEWTKDFTFAAVGACRKARLT